MESQLQCKKEDRRILTDRRLCIRRYFLAQKYSRNDRAQSRALFRAVNSSLLNDYMQGATTKQMSAVINKYKKTKPWNRINKQTGKQNIKNSSCRKNAFLFKLKTLSFFLFN